MLLHIPHGTVLPDLGATPSPELPKPWAVFRAQGNERLLPWRGAVSGVSYSGNSAAGNPQGPAVRFAGGTSDGAQFTYVDQPDRTSYAAYVLFRIRAVSANHTVLGLDGGTPLQLRVNSSFQLEALSEGAALLATSTYAGFVAGSVHRIFVRMQPGGPLVIVRNGQTIISYASGQDIGIVQKRITFGRRSGTGETADMDMVEAWHWSGSTPSLEQGRRLTVDPFNTLYDAQQIYAPFDVLPPVVMSAAQMAGITNTGGTPRATVTYN